MEKYKSANKEYEGNKLSFCVATSDEFLQIQKAFALEFQVREYVYLPQCYIRYM